MVKILIVEDDAPISGMLKDALIREGYAPEQAFSGTEARLLAERGDYSLVILDLMLPGMTGEEFLALYRAKTAAPVLVLSAKGAIDTKVDLLRMGADDYLTKPFHLKELLARVETLLRRSENLPSAQRIGKLRLSESTWEILYDEVPLELTRQEFSILSLLIRYPHRVFTKDELFSEAWGDYYEGGDKTLHVHLSNLRKKIRSAGAPDFIRTVWGVGFALDKTKL